MSCKNAPFTDGFGQCAARVVSVARALKIACEGMIAAEQE